MAAYNTFAQMPYIPYRIIEYLALNNENIWKLLKYGTYDAINKSNLSLDEKLAMVWKGQSDTENYNVFFGRLMEDAEPDSETILKIYKYISEPKNTIISNVCYEFDILYGGKLSVIDYFGIPCNRGEVFETELLHTLNGKSVGGVGMLQFNRQLSAFSKSSLNLGNNKTYTGNSLIMVVQLGSISENDCI